MKNQPKEQISREIAREESMPLEGQVHKDKNAVFVEYDPKIAMEKLLALPTNQNNQEKLQYVKHFSELIQIIGESSIAKLHDILHPLTKDNDDIKRELLKQVQPLVRYLQQRGDQGYKEIIKHIVPVISTLLGGKSYEIKEEAGEEMANIAVFLNEKDRGEYFLTPVLAMSHDDENEENRMIAVQLLSKMAPVFGKELCEQFIGLEFLSKGEDPQIRVRKEAVTHLNSIGKVVSHEFFEKRLLPFYLRLCKDQTWGVRKACVDNVCEIAAISDETTRESQLTEVLLAFLKDSSKWVKVAAYKNLGPFIATLMGRRINDKLIESYLTMTESSVNGLSQENEIIFECAYNFPAVLYTLGGSQWSRLFKLFKSLIKGPEKVKRPLACSLHEIAKIIGEEQAEKDLFKVMTEFLNDPNDKIKYGVIQNLASFIEVFHPDKRENMIDIFLQLQKDQKKWRIRELIANQIDKLASIFSTDIVFQIIVPISFKLCGDVVSIVREEASKKIYSLLDNLYNSQDVHRQSIIENIKGFSQSNRFIHRQSFVFMCGTLMDNPERFKAHFLQSFVVLGTDKVPNVRILVAKALYEKYAVGSPLFGNEEIIALVKVMKSDKSRDVQAWISKVDLENVSIDPKLLEETTADSIKQEESKVPEPSQETVNTSLNSEAPLLGNNDTTVTTDNSMIAEEPPVVAEDKNEHKESGETTDLVVESNNDTSGSNAEQNQNEISTSDSSQEKNVEEVSTSANLESSQPVKNEQKMDVEPERKSQENANENEVNVSKADDKADKLESDGEVKNETV